MKNERIENNVYVNLQLYTYCIKKQFTSKKEKKKHITSY